MASSHSRASCQGRSRTQTKATSASRAVSYYLLMIRITFGLLILSTLSASGQISNSIWMNVDNDWKHPETGDPELDSTFYGNVSSIFFADNGRIVIRNGYGSFTELDTIYHWTGNTIYGGTWKQINNYKIKIKYELMTAIIEPTNQKKDNIELATLDKNGQNLFFNNQKYVKAKRLSNRDKKFIVALIEQMK